MNSNSFCCCCLYMKQHPPKTLRKQLKCAAFKSVVFLLPHTSYFKWGLLPAASVSRGLAYFPPVFPPPWCTHVDFEVISSFPPCWKQHLLIPAAASKVAYSSRPSYIQYAGPSSNQILLSKWQQWGGGGGSCSHHFVGKLGFLKGFTMSRFGGCERCVDGEILVNRTGGWLVIVVLVNGVSAPIRCDLKAAGGCVL